jgi:dTDP-4-dehydrorhamnose reductase
MRILITGGLGQLGRTLTRRMAEHELHVIDLPAVDIADHRALAAAVTAIRPATVIHCAAMTAVDDCESDADRAFRVNAVGTANVAIAAARVGARLIAISTDYVFGGDLERPYHEWDPPGPRTVYGASKLAGEEAVRAHCADHCIVRVAWLYGPGGPSFVHSMLRLGSQDGGPLRVVDDQVGNPTSTDAVADRLTELLAVPVAGTIHLTCEGDASWFELAREIFSHRPTARTLQPCTTADFPRPAARPANSRLEKRALRLYGLAPMPDWRVTLRRFFAEHPNG